LLFAEKMPAKVFVGNLPYGVTSEMIRPLFEHYGPVTECDVLGSFGFVVSIQHNFAVTLVFSIFKYDFMSAFVVATRVRRFT